MSKFNTLRAVSHRLNNTPAKELPHIAYFLASSIQNCADVLKSTSEQSSGKDDDLTLQIHKLKARITSLLQDRSAEGRFTAVVLVKAIVEAGGREILGSCEPWLRGLLAILSKSDPASSKRLCLLTITRIFSLTQQYPTLIREITTPLLPAFVTACMNLGSLNPSRSDDAPPARSSPHLETVLQCMLELIPDHPSTFRPFASKLQTTLAKFIGGQSYSDPINHLAQSVFVTLHFCAPKNTAGDEWLNACQAVIKSIHEIADQIFRAIIEDWETSHTGWRHASLRKAFDETPRSIEGDPLGLPTWAGILPGSTVLVSLLHLLKTFLLQQTSQLVVLPIGLILDLTSRMLYIRVPAHSKERQASIRFNPEVGREEREELLAVLPDIHESTLDLLSSLVEATGLSILPACPTIVDQCLWVFETESIIETIRLQSYKLLENITPLIGPSVTKDSFKPFSAIVDSSCRDVSRSLENESTVQSTAGSNIKPATNGHADSFLQASSKKIAKSQPQISALEVAASNLICRILEYIPTHAIPHSLRAQIDRMAILQDQKRILLASVLNPAPRTADKYATPSVMPFLARTSHDELEIEGLLRPRMPVIREAKIPSYDLEAESDEDIGHEDEHFNDLELAADGPSTEVSAEQEVNGPRNNNDILDRLEDSIEDRTVSTSQIEIPPIMSAEHATVEPLEGGDDGHPPSDLLNQGAKRNIDTVYEDEEAESSKRFRNNELTSQLDPAAPLEEAIAGASARTVVAVDADTAVRVEAELGATLVDKGKARAVDVSPKPEDPAACGNDNVGDDDESDSDMPPLYLKTTDSEREEDEDEDEEMNW
jgi:pre-rRNA-processing protein RIX1